jgi:hypothetical protein
MTGKNEAAAAADASRVQVSYTGGARDADSVKRRLNLLSVRMMPPTMKTDLRVR